MATNKYFNHFHQKNEQSLVQSLVEESVKIHGIDAIYIPRKQQKYDNTFGEDVLKNFEDYYFVEIYIKNVQSFDGDQDIFTKFGLDIKNQITFSVSRSGFSKNVGPDLIRPREGDLIYLPMSTATALYEIQFVKEDTVFFNLGEFYIYDLQCEQFTFSNENVKTGLDDVDALGSRGENLLTVTLGTGTGSFRVGEVIYQGDSLLGADAKATIVEIGSGFVKVKDMFGMFAPNKGPIKGETAEYYTPVLEADVSVVSDDVNAQNDTMKYEADSVIDFTEYNPFSEEDF